jgi:hypothetical protein
LVDDPPERGYNRNKLEDKVLRIQDKEFLMIA